MSEKIKSKQTKQKKQKKQMVEKLQPKHRRGRNF